LQVESVVGQGSAFWFDVTLPVTEIAAREEPTPVWDIVGYEGPRRKVLVVDDKQYNRLLLVDILDPLGFEVSTANDGQQAVDMALELQPDAIVVDNVMPVKTGLEAVREIRKQSEFKDIVIIAVSASAFEKDREESREAGCNAFLPKPIKAEALLDSLATHLGLSWITAEPDVESKAPLVPPSAEELAALHELASSRRMCDIREQATRLAEMDVAYIPFARKLQALVRRCEIDQIKAFVESFIEDALVPPPQEELVVLLDLARRGDMRTIQGRATHIETLGEQYVPFADKLRKLAKGFEERQIRTLIEKYVEEDQ
jgi:CheY-like chemotaxis protein